VSRDAAPKILSIQILRFFAAAIVVYHHAAQLAWSVGRSGQWLAPELFPLVGSAGVDVFFIVSGFVITMTGPAATPRPSATLFFWRRWSRVAPLFYLISVPTVLVLALPLNRDQTIATLFFWPAAGSRIVAPYVGLGWSLCFEMLFYSTVTLLLAGGRLRRNGWLIASTAIVLIALRLVTPTNALRVIANPIFLEFGVGVGFALLYDRLKRIDPIIGLPLLGFGVGLFVILGFKGMGDVYLMEPTLRGTNAFWRVGLFGVPATFVVAGMLLLEPWLQSAVPRALGWLGNASYSIYLVHGLVNATLYAVWRAAAPPGDVTIMLALPAGILAGVLSYHWVERPLLRAVRWLPTAFTVSKMAVVAAVEGG
jgi:exopolysaccharide production protein ExoZ